MERQQVILLALILAVALGACSQPVQPELTATPSARPSTVTTVAAPTAKASRVTPTPERPPTATNAPTPSPTPALPGPVADFLRTATPVPALPAPVDVRLEMPRLFYTPPDDFLTLDPAQDIAPFDLISASVPRSFRVESVADNVTHTLWAVEGYDAVEGLDEWKSSLYVVTVSTGEAHRVKWDPDGDDQPIQELRWLGEDILVFSQWLSPIGGYVWALDVPARKIAAKGVITSPELAPAIKPQISDEPLPRAHQTSVIARDGTPASPASTPLTCCGAAPTPEPTRGPIKQILVSFGYFGGDGGTSYDVLYGRQVPKLVLYTDGQLLISGEQYGSQEWYVEKMLSTDEMCRLLSDIRATGFFEVEGSGRLCENDPIYQNPAIGCMGCGGIGVLVNGQPNKWVGIDYCLLDQVVPALKAAYDFVRNYRPGGMTAYTPDRVLLRVQREPGEDFWHETPVAPGPRWAEGLPSLRAAAAEKPEGGEMVLSEDAAAFVLRSMPLPSASYFTEAGVRYFVVGRPLLPHESLDYYSRVAWEAESFELPFDCP